jgi:large subunit ribosomal protein L6e
MLCLPHPHSPLPLSFIYLTEIARSINAVGKAKKFKAGGWKAVALGAKGKKTEKKVVVAKTNSKWYQEDDSAPKVRTKTPNAAAALRSSITPGTVLIILAGKFRGKRVVFVNQLASGLLLIVGPFSVNGVPLRRVNQSYVIATSTKVELPAAVADAVKDINDATFKTQKAANKKVAKADFTESKTAPKFTVSADIKSATKAVDKLLVPVINKTEYLKAYLGSKFSLSKGQYPHNMKF